MGSFQQSLVGQTLPVLVDGYDAEAKRLVGRTFADAPEVDCRVLLPKGIAEPGTFVDARITAANDYELTAEVAGAVEPA
jgi:ribosomal protein S12 methylthiotransferase